MFEKEGRRKYFVKYLFSGFAGFISLNLMSAWALDSFGGVMPVLDNAVNGDVSNVQNNGLSGFSNPINHTSDVYAKMTVNTPSGCAAHVSTGNKIMFMNPIDGTSFYNSEEINAIKKQF